jgi:hypothetical protein
MAWAEYKSLALGSFERASARWLFEIVRTLQFDRPLAVPLRIQLLDQSEGSDNHGKGSPVARQAPKRHVCNPLDVST